MKKTFAFVCSTALAVSSFISVSYSQDLVEKFLNFDATSEGPWSDIANTTLTIPKVANGSVKADANVSAGEYGGKAGVDVIPAQNGWILGFAQAKEWKGTDDNSFTFYTAYDDEFLYIGVNVKDDVVRSNDPNDAFWKDDAIEIIFGNNPGGFDYNTDSVAQEYGGHSYVNFEGRFSEWNETDNLTNLRRFSLAIDWAYGENEEVWGFGQETPGGWTMECRFHRSLIEDPALNNPFEEGNSFIFNIGMDDDDGGDLAIQYFWANRVRAIGFNPDSEFIDLLTEEELANKDFLNPDSSAAFWVIGINDNGRLSTSGAGEMILGTAVADIDAWSLY